MELKDQLYESVLPLGLVLLLPSRVTVVPTLTVSPGPALAVGNWPPAPAVCVEFEEGVVMHPAVRTLATTMTAIAPATHDFFIANISNAVYARSPLPLDLNYNGYLYSYIISSTQQVILS
jgi:hypothetical protein